tara:strand:- start:20 stop:733 length:714 start_codon:yes stop_codon:yes gene_type:complete
MKHYPENIAIIMDGNRRWALNKGQSSHFGHRIGTKVLKKVVLYCNSLDIKELTVFAFSTENWRRPESEVSALFLLAERFLTSEIADLNKNNVKLSIIGSKDIINQRLVKLFNYSEKLTSNNTGICLNIALNYGGKKDIVQSVKAISEKTKNGLISIKDINEDIVSEHLYSSNVNNVDLLIRTGGEKRISNFLPWQLSYSEIYFSEKLWPDFSEKEIHKAFEFFSGRERRYGASQAIV